MQIKKIVLVMLSLQLFSSLQGMQQTKRPLPGPEEEKAYEKELYESLKPNPCDPYTLISYIMLGGKRVAKKSQDIFNFISDQTKID